MRKYPNSLKQTGIIIGALAICLLFISSATAVSHVEGSTVVQSMKISEKTQTFLDTIESLKTRWSQRYSTKSLLQGSSQGGFLRIMLTLLLKFLVNIAQLTKGVTIGLVNLVAIILKLTITLLIGTQKILTVAAVGTIYLGIKTTIGTLKFFKAVTPVAAKLASIIASILTPLIGALVSGAVFALSAAAAAALFLAIPLVLLLLVQSFTGESLIPESSDE